MTGHRCSKSILGGVAIVTTLLVAGLVVDLMRPPAEQWSAALLLLAIDGYQAGWSRKMEHAGVRCRFEPTCSHYAEAVIRRDGAAVGLWRTAVRLARCGPWTPLGTADPP